RIRLDNVVSENARNIKEEGSMRFVPRTWVTGFVVRALLASSLAPATAMAAPAATGYRQIDLISSMTGVARKQDTTLVNPWGIEASSQGVLFVADNGSGAVAVVAAHNRTARTVTVPTPDGTGVSAPTGLVPVPGKGFMMQSGERTIPAHL